MRKRMFGLLTVMLLSLGFSITAFADIKTGLIGQYDFDGDLKNEVTGESAKLTGEFCSKSPKVVEAEFTNGVTEESIVLDGYILNYGLELKDCVPSSNTFTVSYDIFYTRFSLYSPTMFMYNDTGDTNDTNVPWANFGWGWQANMNYAPGLWIFNNQQFYDCIPSNPDVLTDSFGKYINWTNITYSVSDGVVNIYVNGKKIDLFMYNIETSTPILNFINENTKLFVGVDICDTPISAAMDNLYIYDRALSDSDVLELISYRDYDVAMRPILHYVEEPSTEPPSLANKDNADYLVPAETTAPITESVYEKEKYDADNDDYDDDNDNDKKSDGRLSIAIIIICMASIVLVSCIVSIAVILNKNKK